jgi:hypothetical protein
MWRCDNCGAEFEEPRKYQEKYEFWGSTCYREFPCCPGCRSDCIEEIEESEVEEDGLG